MAAVAPIGDAFVLAGHGRRIGAAVLDGVLGTFIIGACGAAGFGVGLLGAGGSDADGWEALGWILVGTILGAMAGVAAWLALTIWLVRRPGARNGQTIGKQMIGIRVVRADRREIGVGWALGREFLAKWVLVGMTSSLISTMMGFFDVGLIGALAAVAIWYGPAFFDEQRRALHDRICDTRVVDAHQIQSAPPPPTADEDLWPAPA
ncbi:MAG: hypothetical protein QOE31_2521 [Solirubrobacteraceae bacterium]|nr:hypothetical protein [Solirubrobacteraceae bacterium]